MGKKIITILHSKFFLICFCLFDLILYVPSAIFHLNRDGSSWVEPVLSKDKCVLLKDHNPVTPVRLEPAVLRSPVRHSTTEPLRVSGPVSLWFMYFPDITAYSNALKVYT